MTIIASSRQLMRLHWADNKSDRRNDVNEDGIFFGENALTRRQSVRLSMRKRRVMIRRYKKFARPSAHRATGA